MSSTVFRFFSTFFVVLELFTKSFVYFDLKAGIGYSKKQKYVL